MELGRLNRRKINLTGKYILDMCRSDTDVVPIDTRLRAWSMEKKLAIVGLGNVRFLNPLNEVR